VKFIGILGLVCIAAGWIPPTFKTIRQGSTDLPLSFLGLMAAGNLSLTVYSILNFDPIYLVLNLLALLQGCINLFFKIFPRTQ